MARRFALVAPRARDVEEERLAAEIRRFVREALAQADGPASDAAGGSSGHPSEYAFATYVEGRLQGIAEETFERHVAMCPKCAEELVLAHRAGIASEPGYSRRTWKIAAAIAIVLGGLVAALLAAGAVGGRLEAGLIAALEHAMGDKAHIETASLSFEGGPGVDLGNLTVADPGGGPPMVAAPAAHWSVNLAAVPHGRIEGALKLHGAIINVVREPSGTLNVDAILPRSTGDENLFAKARRRAIQNVEIASGTLRLIDKSSGDPRELRMAAVDASLTNISGPTPAHVVARAGLESTRQNMSVDGEIGPWGDGRKPVYRFPEVALDTVALRNLPGIGSVMRGGLSFDGSLASAGDSWSEIASQFSGSGDLRVVSGSIAGRNLVRDVVSPLLGDGGNGATLPSGLASLVAGDETTFGEMHSPVAIAGSRIAANDFFASTSGFSVAGQGSLGGDGSVEFHGSLNTSVATTRELIAFAPGAGNLVDEHGEIAIPFSLSGQWPAVRIAVDVERLAHRMVLRQGLASLFFLGAPPLPGSLG